MADSTPTLTLDHLGGGVATYLPGESFGPRVLNDYELVWIIDGDAVYRHDGTAVDAPAGTIIFGKRGASEEYRWDVKRQTRHAFFHFGITTMPDDWPPLEAWPVSRRMKTGDAVRPLFRRVLDRWCQRWNHGRLTPTPQVCRLVAALLDAYLDAGAERSLTAGHPLPDPVQLALRWTAQRLMHEPDAPLTLDELASQVHVSTSQLNRLFRRSLGLTPMRALQMMRLEQAMTLLERSNLSVSQIASRCGFGSAFHFSRLFRQTYGLPPRAMRRQFEHGDVRPPSPLPIDAPSLTL